MNPTSHSRRYPHTHYIRRAQTVFDLIQHLALGRCLSAQSRLVRPVYDLGAETKDNGEYFFLLFGSNLKLVQRIFKIPSHDFKITSGDAETMVRLFSGSANDFARSAGNIAQQILVLLLELCPSIITHPNKELVDAFIGKKTVSKLVYDGRYSVIAAKALIKWFCVGCIRGPS